FIRDGTFRINGRSDLPISKALGRAATADNLIDKFLKKRDNGELATDQLLNAIYLVTRENSPTDTKDDLIEKILKYLDSSEDS
ncbi:MAG: hypothetical protein ACKPKU_22355, partial [Dolichospermum sp.]